MERNEVEQQMKVERRAWKRLERLAPKVAEAAVPIWEQGDGEGGAVQAVLDKEFKARGLRIPIARLSIFEALNMNKP